MTEELSLIISNQSIGYILKSPKNKHLLDELISLTSFLNELYNEITIGQRVWHIKNNIYFPQLCEICEKPQRYDRGKYTRCYSCGQQIAKNTLISKTPEEQKEILQKQKETNILRYGVENPVQNKKILEKIEKTNIEKCGHKRQSSTKLVKDKIKKTTTEKYGGLGNSSKIIKEKHNKTTTEKYGGIGMKSDSIKKKYKNSCKILYGSNYYFASKLFNENRILDSLFFDYINNEESIEYIKRKSERVHVLKCNKCNNEFEITTSNRYRINNNFDICPICNPINNQISNLERQLQEFLINENSCNCLFNVRNIIKNHEGNNLELDVYFPDLKIAIEFNGDYWHANPKIYEKDEIVGKDHNTAKEIWERDFIKQQICEYFGIKLFVVWEYEWINNRKIVECQIRKFIQNGKNK